MLLWHKNCTNSPKRRKKWKPYLKAIPLLSQNNQGGVGVNASAAVVAASFRATLSGAQMQCSWEKSRLISLFSCLNNLRSASFVGWPIIITLSKRNENAGGKRTPPTVTRDC